MRLAVVRDGPGRAEVIAPRTQDAFSLPFGVFALHDDVVNGTDARTAFTADTARFINTQCVPPFIVLFKRLSKRGTLHDAKNIAHSDMDMFFAQGNLLGDAINPLFGVL